MATLIQSLTDSSLSYIHYTNTSLAAALAAAGFRLQYPV